VRSPSVSGIFPDDIISDLGRADLDIRGVRARKLIFTKIKPVKVREISERFWNIACTTHNFYFYSASVFPMAEIEPDK
jgi:hypothetical protein